MQIINQPLLLGVLLLATLLPGTALAESFTGNIGVTSNYIWRGVTQTEDEAAVQGGLDYEANQNFYVGVWTSSLNGNNNYELDYYAGYRGKSGNFSYDIALYFYTYPTQDNDDVTEVIGKLDFDMFSFEAGYTIDRDDTTEENDLYLAVGTALTFRKDLTLNLLFGMYEYDDAGFEDYNHFHASLSKNDFTFALDKNDKDAPANADEMRISVSWSKAFDL